MTTNENDANPVEEAKAYARKALLETYPDARETAEPTNASYEHDAIIIEDETCDVREIAIMHDEASNTFALVERSRAALELAAEAEHELVVADLLQAAEVKVMMLAQSCRTQDEITAAGNPRRPLSFGPGILVSGRLQRRPPAPGAARAGWPARSR